MLGIVIPVFDCDDTIKDLVSSILQLDVGRVFLVDDASHVPVRLSFSEVEVIRNSENLGYSSSVLRGMDLAEQSGCSSIATIDGDAAHFVEDLGKLSEVWKEYPGGLLIGDRMGSQSFRYLPTKKLANQISSLLISNSFGGDTTSGKDVSSGLRIYEKSFVKAVKGLHNERFGLCYSSIYAAVKGEFPLRWTPIEVMYPPHEFHFTKAAEFYDLVQQAAHMNDREFNIRPIGELVASRSSFNISSWEMIVFALYMKEFDGYFFRELETPHDGFERVEL